MTIKHTAEEQRRLTLHAMHASGLDLQSVWIRYYSLTGNANEFEVDAYLNGLISLTSPERDLVSHAVNELIAETSPPTAPYSNEPDDLNAPDDPGDPDGFDVFDNPEVMAALNAWISLYHRDSQDDRNDPDRRDGRDGRDGLVGLDGSDDLDEREGRDGDVGEDRRR
jgi:hypothetical protein